MLIPGIYWHEYMLKGMMVLNLYGMAEDTLRCDAVWQRVLPNMEPYPEVRRQAAERKCETLTEKDILRFIEDELSDRCTYMALSRKGRNKCEMRQLAAIGADEARHAKKLQAAYYLMTGCHANVKMPKLPEICCYTDELRQRYYEEKKGHLQYLAAAERAEDERLKQLLLCLAEEESGHADTIWSLFV